MNKIEYCTKIHGNLQIVHGDKIHGYYVCPICLKEYSKQDVNILTKEDVPQASLGGSRITLTCNKCNNRCGHEIDVHLFNAIKAKEYRLFLPGSKRKIHIKKAGKILNANIQIEQDRSIKLLVDTKRNNPNTWNDFHDNILLPNEVVNIEEQVLKKDKSRINVALIKNAYLLLFAKTGYTFLLDKYYDTLRRQILEPDVPHIPDKLWTIQNIPIPDGIYLTQDNRYRGFFVIYTLKLGLSYRVCTLIPTPNIPYLMAVDELRKINAGCCVKVARLPDLDFLNDEKSIKKLRTWCYGWAMEL